MDTLDLDGKQYEVIGHADDGLPIIRGVAIATQDGTDDDGNPRISVNVTVPPITIGVAPGESK